MSRTLQHHIVQPHCLVGAGVGFQRDGDLLLNLIHYQVGHQGANSAIPSIEKVYPIRDIACRVRAAEIQRVVLEPDGEDLDFSTENGYVSFTVPSIQYLGMVRLAR